MRATIRPSSFIFRSGTGSIVDLPDRESILMMGTAFWRGHEIIREERLEAACDVNHFGSPTNIWDEKSRMMTGIASRDFPLMLMCPKCGKLFYSSGYKNECPKCDVKAIPPRLVAACNNGHLQDFPWKWWCGCKCSDPNLVLVARENMSAGIELGNSDTIVKCQNCNQQRSLMGALGVLRSASGETTLSCFGNRPWVADKEECDQVLRGFMRGASNLYFPVVRSSLSIPPFSKEIQKLVRKHKNKSSRRRWDEGKIREYIEFRDELMKFVDEDTYKIEDLEMAFNVMYGKRDPHSSIKKEEWDTFTHDSRLEIGLGTNDDFKASVLDISSSKLSDWFDVVLKVRKLREVVTLQGFTRNEPYNGSIEDVKRIQYVNDRPNNWDLLITKDIKPYLKEEDLNWLPGVEQYGEGIFFKFNEKRLSKWMDQKELISRWRSIISNDSEIPLEKDGIDTKDPKILLVHTFAHHFIRQISLSCGYPSPSLRERLYVGNNDENMCGVLIYTASTDSEGSLGGLVSQAKDSKVLLEHIQEMVDSAKICSQDPLCSSHDSRLTGDPWGASCHSCTHLAETSCEGLQNKLLDRFALISNGSVKGYFEE